ncbi:hypothetical protein [Roseinatronobacter sp.]
MRRQNTPDNLPAAQDQEITLLRRASYDVLSSTPHPVSVLIANVNADIVSGNCGVNPTSANALD